MSISDSVVVAIAISLSASPQVESISTPMVAAYHNHYASRFKLYEAAGGAGLSQMVTDGFLVTDPAYKAASAICSQSPSPSNFAIGKRTLPTQQTLTVTCVDGTVGDAYGFTVVGGTGLSHSVAYTVPVNLGAAVSGTVSVTNGSNAITFSGAQTMSTGDLLVFSSQPGVAYALSAPIVAATVGTLTANFQGTTSAAATSTHLATLAGTFNAINGNATVATSTSQVGVVSPGDSLEFVSQLGTFYTVASVTAGDVVLTNPYSGVTAGATHASDVATIGSVATAIGAVLSPLVDLGTVAVAANVITISRTDGQLNDVQGWRANGLANIQLQDTSADPGIASDLAAIYRVDSNDWYSLVLDSNSEAEIRAAATWIESTGQGGKVFFANNSDAGNGDQTVTSDVFSLTQVSGFFKTHIQQNNSQLLCYAGASTAAWTGARNPGSYALAQGMSLPGVPADTEQTLPESEALVINAHTASNPTAKGKGGNFYKVTAGINASFWGFTPGGRFMHNTIFIDWLQVNMQADVFGVLSGLPKVPLTDTGIGLIGDAIDTRLRIGASAAFGGIDGSLPITVTLPSAASLAVTDRAAGNLQGVSWECHLANAIETAVVQGTLID